MGRLRRIALPAAAALFAVCALWPQVAASGIAAQGGLSAMAPADRYFGRLKLSYITINNTFQHTAIQAGEYTTDSGIANKVDFAMEALNDWRNQFPRDPHLSRSYFLGQITLKKIWIKDYQDKAWSYMQYIVTTYPTSYFGKTIAAELAKGFTQHYFAPAVPCGEPAPALPSGPVDNGKFKVVVHAAPCMEAAPSPSPAPASAAPAGVALAGVSWKLVELEGKAVVTPPNAVAPSLHFDAAEKRVSGSTGCNNLTGTYAFDGATLHLSPLATTRMACLNPDVQALETAFLAALQKVTSYRIEGGNLRLLAGETLVATFARSASD